MDEQSNIADVLSTYDSLIGNNVRRIQVLEKMTKLIYNEWFVKFKFPDHEKVRLFDSRPGDIPEGWETVELGAIADENRRSVEPNEVDPDTPYVGLEHLSRNSITLTEWGVAKESLSSKMRFRKDEILFGKIRPYFHKVATAPVDGICSTDIIVVSPKAREYLPVVLGAVSSDHFIDYATTTSQGTKMPRANWSVLKRYPVSIPPSRLLQEADALVRDIVDLLNKLMFENRNLKKTRDLLLPRLISGETKVSRLGVKGTGMEA
jgi:type I restriction enzyme S subunit